MSIIYFARDDRIGRFHSIIKRINVSEYFTNVQNLDVNNNSRNISWPCADIDLFKYSQRKSSFKRPPVLWGQGPISQKVVNHTISDHLPTKSATVSQNLSECFYDFRFTTCGFVRRYADIDLFKYSQRKINCTVEKEKQKCWALNNWTKKIIEWKYRLIWTICPFE
jgi:hypothetical protein